MEFNFNNFRISMGQIDIEDIGNLAIEGINDKQMNFYLVIRTSCGQSSIFQYGPIIPDINLFPKKVSCTFERIQFKEATIVKIINQWLNNPTNSITQAKEIDFDEAYDSCRDIINYMREYNEENNY